MIEGSRDLALADPLRSLQSGRWFKLICGASYQYLPAIEHLTRIYALAGVDCIDVAADPAVIAVARKALETLDDFRGRESDRWGSRPWLMVSLNDGEDPHFRKATFDPHACPVDCPRPCQRICPTQAISFSSVMSSDEGRSEGVQADRCYGCGRCLPVCPVQQIETRSHLIAPDRLLPQIMDSGVDALELHTQVGHDAEFETLWKTIAPWLPRLKGLAISCPFAPGAVDYLKTLADRIAPLPCPLIWQADGRPMSGDIGSGTTHATIAFAQALLESELPGYVQLAGGTNAYTVPKLAALGLLQRFPDADQRIFTKTIAGVAYGSYARKLLEPFIEPLMDSSLPIDSAAAVVWLKGAIDRAKSLIDPLKIP